MVWEHHWLLVESVSREGLPSVEAAHGRGLLIRSQRGVLSAVEETPSSQFRLNVYVVSRGLVKLWSVRILTGISRISSSTFVLSLRTKQLRPHQSERLRSRVRKNLAVLHQGKQSNGVLETMDSAHVRGVF